MFSKDKKETDSYSTSLLVCCLNDTGFPLETQADRLTYKQTTTSYTQVRQKWIKDTCKQPADMQPDRYTEIQTAE